MVPYAMTDGGNPILGARNLTPLLRWAGGKRWLASAIRRVGDLIGPEEYVEPFVGGGSVFFATEWPKPLLVDRNLHLIRCYLGLIEDVALVRRKLTRLEVDRDTYAYVSNWRPTSMTGAAARLLYLNRVAYGGIYRENRYGQFNVPYSGDRALASILGGDRLEGAAAVLAQARLVADDFSFALASAGPRALIYCDPPYSLPGKERGFRRYGRVPFSWEDQIRLAEALQKSVGNGATAIVSNSADDQVRALYPNAHAIPLVRRSSLSRLGSEQKEALYVLHSQSEVSEDITTVLTRELSL